jgi:hypothetical protein
MSRFEAIPTNSLAAPRSAAHAVQAWAITACDVLSLTHRLTVNILRANSRVQAHQRHITVVPCRHTGGGVHLKWMLRPSNGTVPHQTSAHTRYIQLLRHASSHSEHPVRPDKPTMTLPDKQAAACVAQHRLGHKPMAAQGNGSSSEVHLVPSKPAYTLCHQTTHLDLQNPSSCS